MFCRSKLLICFHAVAFFSIRVISAMYTNHIDARSINVNWKEILYDSFVYDSYNDR